MSDKSPTAETFTPSQPDDSEWQTVSEERPPETKLEFWDIGDQFTGEFLGAREVPGQNRSYTQYRFQGQDGNTYFAAGASLDEGMRKVFPGNRVRLTYINDQDTGQPTPMKIFRVEISAVKGLRPAQRAGITRAK